MIQAPQRIFLALAAALAVGLCGASAAAESPPVTVSPGAFERPTTTADGCAPFSWASSPQALGYELEILPAAHEAGGETAPVLRAVLQGQVGAWQPGADRCLAAGTYRWRVRARVRHAAGEAAGPWSVPRAFVVAATAAPAFEQAARTMERYLRHSGPDGSLRLAGGAAPSPDGDGLGEVDEEALRRSLVAASLTGGKAGLRATRSESSGAFVGAIGTTSAAAAAGVVGANYGGGPDVVLSGDMADPDDLGYLLSDAPGNLRLQSGRGISIRAAGLTVFDGASEIFRLDTDGLVTATSFDGDGAKVTGVTASQLACTGCVSPNGEIADGSLTTADVAGLTGSDVGTSTIGSGHVVDGQVFAHDFAANSIGIARIGDGAVRASKIVTGAVGSPEISTGAVRSSEILDGGVRASDLGTVWRVKVTCNGDCNGSGEGVREVCETVRPGSRPLGVSCSALPNITPVTGRYACGGDNACYENSISLLCQDVSGHKDAIVLCLDD